MKNYFFRAPLFGGALLCLIATSACFPRPASAQNTRIEAETNPTAGDMKIIELPDASGGKAVSIGRDYQPLLRADLPKEGDAFTIWVRYSDDRILLKKRVNGKSSDLKWLYGKPKKLEWVKAGRFKREEIGERLEIIRGGGGGQGAILDAVVFATDENYDPNGDAATPAANAPVVEEKTEANEANLNESAAVALGIQKAPKGTLFEAEDYSQGDLVNDAEASGGKAVTSDRDWQPLVTIPLPAGESWRVWVRHKNSPFALKTVMDGKKRDTWNYNKATEWTWREIDVFTREELGGSKLTIGRNAGGKKEDAVLIDAIVLSPEAKRPLPPDAPDADAKAQKISASIDWDKTAGQVSPMLWGINEQQVLDPEKAADTTYQKLLGELNSPLIRIHQADLIRKWTDADQKDWDVSKIKKAFAASSGYGDAKLMICISRLPAWIAGGKPAEMTPADEDAFAALCGRLVGIMRDDVKRDVDYWEITNEWEKELEKTGKLDVLWRTYNKCAAAIRKEDPNAKIGGPALTWAKSSWVNGFLENCPDAQFISWHNYASGDIYETNEKVYAQVEKNVGNLAQGVLDALKKHDRPMETFLTETNIKYSWDPYERRHQNVVGSVFHALVVKEMAEKNVTGIALWVQKGEAYGSLVDGKNQTYPTYQLYRWGEEHLSGKLASSTSGDATKLQLLPVTRADGKKAVLVMNKSDHSVVVPAAQSLLTGAKTMQRIDATGVGKSVAVAEGEMTLPGYSLTLLLN